MSPCLPGSALFNFEFDFDFDTLEFTQFARVGLPYETGLELTRGLFCGWQRTTAAGRCGAVSTRRRSRGGGGRTRGSRGDPEGAVLLFLENGYSFVGEEGGRALGRLQPGRA